MSDEFPDIVFMRRAIDLGLYAASLGEVPVGAVIVFNEEVVSAAYNEREGKPSAIAHAEMTAIAGACRNLGRWRLSGCTLYVTLEPCLMCAGAIVNARLDRVVYGASDPKAGAVSSLYEVLSDKRLNHRPKIAGGVLEEDCGKMLSDFFAARRLNPK